MLKILKQLAKGNWKEDVAAKKAGKRKPRKRKSAKKSREELIEAFFRSIKKETVNNGSKSIPLYRIFNRIGVKKRSSSSVKDLNRAITEYGYYVSPDITMKTEWRTRIKISRYPDIQLGHLFPKERDLEDYIDEHGLYSKIGIESVKRQFSPKGTRDRLDFLGITGEQKIVLELKHKDGGKSAIEQVLRYAGLLMENLKSNNMDPASRVRKILVTGIQNRETAYVFKALTSEERENFEWYLYDYNSKTGDLDFVRITEADIENQLNVQPN